MRVKYDVVEVYILWCLVHVVVWSLYNDCETECYAGVSEMWPLIEGFMEVS
jgi:hypothetical protein